MKRNTIFGYRISDAIGMLVMVIPIVISIIWSARGGFLCLKEYNITPTLQSACVACVFYLALIIRTDLFKKDTLGETVVSVFRSILNIWVLASMIEICIPENKFFNKFALAAIIFAWLGMKTIAGYGWILFLIGGINNIVTISKLMGGTGAIYIIAIAISLFLQVYSLSSIQEFWKDFSHKTDKQRNIIKEDVESAGENAKKNIKAVTETVEKVAGIHLNDE